MREREKSCRPCHASCTCMCVCGFPYRFDRLAFRSSRFVLVAALHRCANAPTPRYATSWIRSGGFGESYTGVLGKSKACDPFEEELITRTSAWKSHGPVVVYDVTAKSSPVFINCVDKTLLSLLSLFSFLFLHVKWLLRDDSSVNRR